MGIRGLSSFIEANSHLLTREKLHDTKVIIDGNNLYHFLYYTRNLSIRYGGDYDRFYESAVDYFQSLRKCGISPYVVFDGGSESDNRKLRTVLERMKNRLKSAQAVVNGQHEKILPILTQQVFKFVLDEIGIPHAQCDYEADDQIVALANQWACPVLSQDSDFYIFEIDAGFIPLHFLDIEVKKMDADDTETKYFLNAGVYFVANFTKHFGGISKSLLPVFATLTGNDYVDPEMFAGFYARIKVPKVKSKHLLIGHRHRRMIGVLVWLQNLDCSSTDAIIECVLHFVKKRDRPHLRDLMKASISLYACSSTTLFQCFEDEKMDFCDSKCTTYHNKQLPKWFLVVCRKSAVPTDVLNILSLHRIILLCQVENFRVESANLGSRYIRQVMYGVLMHDCKESPDNYVEEYDRVNKQLKVHKVQPVYELPKCGQLPPLASLQSISVEVKLQVFCETLGTDLIYLELFSKELWLAAAVLYYWVQNAKPQVTMCYIVSLVINFFKGYVIEKSCCEPVGPPSSSYVESERTVFSAVPCSEAKYAKEALGKFCQKPKHSHDFDVKIVHGFAQWQACLRNAMCFNRLLGLPVHNCNPSKLFNGSFAYNLCHSLAKRPNIPSYIAELFGRSSELTQQFETVYAIISSWSNIAPSVEDHGKVERRRKSKMTARNIIQDGNEVSATENGEEKKYGYNYKCDVSNRFDFLKVSSDFPQEQSDSTEEEDAKEEEGGVGCHT